EVERIQLLAGDKLLDVDRACALRRQRQEVLVFDLHPPSGADLVAPRNFSLGDLPAGWLLGRSRGRVDAKTSAASRWAASTWGTGVVGRRGVGRRGDPLRSRRGGGPGSAAPESSSP